MATSHDVAAFANDDGQIVITRQMTQQGGQLVTSEIARISPDAAIALIDQIIRGLADLGVTIRPEDVQ